MTDTKDLIREIQEHTAAHGGENTATHLLVQAVMALQRQADEMAAIGAGGVSGPLLGGPPGSGGWQSYAEAMELQRDRLRKRLEMMEAHRDGQVWYWQGDADDHLERMVNSLPVVIRADQLRALVAQAPQPAITPETGNPATVEGAAITSESAAPQQAAPAVARHVGGVGRFTKKPITIEAIQWTGRNLREVITFTDGPPDTRSHHADMAWEAYADLVASEGLKIYTLEGKMLANRGDWIIRGVKGEYYPCKPDIFEATYLPAAEAAPQQEPADTPSKPQCAECGTHLKKVVQGSNSYLSAEQFDADKLGDWYCDCCARGPSKGSSKHRYFWDSEIAAAAVPQPAPPQEAPAEPSAYPMVGDENESDLGPWQPGTAKPAVDGTYLRDFDEGEGTSEFHQGVWLRDGFFPSDLQGVRWRGRAAPQQDVLIPRETLVAWRQWCAQSMSHAIEHEISDYLNAAPQQEVQEPTTKGREA